MVSAGVVPSYSDLKALMAKYADQTMFPRMIGTMGGMDYLILAKRPEVNLQLGLKPLVTINSNSCQIGFRLRSAPIPNTAVDMEVPLLPGQPGSGMVTQGYPSTGWAFPWEKVSEERASLVRMFTYHRPASQIKHIFKDLKQHRFYGKVTSFLMEQIDPNTLEQTPENMHEFIMALLFEHVSKHFTPEDAQDLYDAAMAETAASQTTEQAGQEPDPENDPDYNPVKSTDPDLGTSAGMLAGIGLTHLALVSTGGDDDPDFDED